MIGFLPLVLLALLCDGCKPKNSSYDSYPVQRSEIRSQVLSNGTVQPENKLDIKPPINGRADSVLAQIGDAVKKGQVLAWMSSTDRAVLLDAARTKGADELAHWEDYYKPAALIAPLDGTIISKNLNPGQVVTSSDVVFSMSDHLIVAAIVDETDLAKIKLQQRVELAVDAYPDVQFTGAVERIAFNAAIVNSVTTYEVDVLPDKVPDFIRSGMTAVAKFLVVEKKDALSVPAAAIRQFKSKSFVLVPDPDHADQAVSRQIEVGISDGKKTEILSGLKEGDTVLMPKFQLSGAGAASSKGNPLVPTVKRNPNPPSTTPR